MIIGLVCTKVKFRLAKTRSSYRPMPPICRSLHGSTQRHDAKNSARIPSDSKHSIQCHRTPNRPDCTWNYQRMQLFPSVDTIVRMLSNSGFHGMRDSFTNPQPTRRSNHGIESIGISWIPGNARSSGNDARTGGIVRPFRVVRSVWTVCLAEEPEKT